MEIFVLFIAIVFFPQFSYATDNITQFQSVQDGKNLVSEDGSFELGFFSPGASPNRYLGIWYRNIVVRTVVWVANRDNPSKDNSSILSINKEGNPVLVNQNGSVLWSARSKTKAVTPILQLLDSGNLILREQKSNDPQSYLWQSFDHPCDTLLPGMKLGRDLKIDLNRRISSWKNWDDPSTVEFVIEVERNSYPGMVIWKNEEKFYRSGPWSGLKFSGIPALKNNPVYDFNFVSNKEEVYYEYSLKNKSVISRLIMNQTANALQRYTWIEDLQTWKIYAVYPGDNCDNYNLCGPYGNCVLGENPVCQCLRGFKPKLSNSWNQMDFAQGCVHNEPWNCKERNKDGFVKFSGLKLPDTSNTWVDATMTLEACKAKCFENCSCTAYANSNASGAGTGCVIWFGNLIDLRQISEAGQDLYIRMVAPEDAKKGHRKMVAAVTITVVLLLLVFLTFLYIYKRRRKFKETALSTENEEEATYEAMELPFFNSVTIAKATNDFSIDKKLGEGGFGPVYRGTLEDGQEIAVKRLSSSSGQGMKEFKNEVILCSKLQHRNLVKLLGCCIQGQNKMLIYEYMPNKSLDYFLFDSFQSKLLDWTKRHHIIFGIARGLLYLHQDSRLRIIHRDLKASNVLLDRQLIPKISDFGLAKMFGGDQIEGNTSKVAGTYGYMAPEYASDGAFSVKSDVFSFGILVLEIISGMKNRSVYYTNNNLNLIGHAWKLWNEGNAMELMDSSSGNSFVVSEVLHCIHIGLLCVQQNPDDRPDMASVIVMLSSECALPQPKEPGFLMGNASSIVAKSSSSNPIISSANEMSFTNLVGR